MTSEVSILNRRAALARLAGIAAGAGMMVPHLCPAAAPLQAVALLPLLYVAAAGEVPRRVVLTAGAYMGLAYTLPQVIVHQMPVGITLVLLAWMTALMTALAGGSALLLARGRLAGGLAVGALLAVLDWANFTVVPIWGTAQSLARPWSGYPAAIAFTSLTGITGIAFALGSFQGLLALAAAGRRRGRALAAAGGVLAVFAAGDLIALRPRPAGKIGLAAVGWVHDDWNAHGGINSSQGFEALIAAPVTAAAAGGARLVVTPEIGVWSHGEQARREWLERFARLARAAKVHLVVGYGCTRAGADENRLFFMDPGGQVLAEYVKTHLTPFESFRRGDGRPVTVLIDGLRVGGMICQDDNFPAMSRPHGRLGVAVMAVPTYDWPAIKDAHLQNGIHRAIECRYAVARAAMGGVSAIISPDGRVLARRDHFTDGPGAVLAEVPVRGEPTPFARLGHWPPALGGGMLLACLGLWLNRRRRRG